MQEQPCFSSSPSELAFAGLSWLPYFPSWACGDPAAGTIKAPKKDEMTGGAPSGRAPASGAKAKKQGRREVELKDYDAWRQENVATLSVFANSTDYTSGRAHIFGCRLFPNGLISVIQFFFSQRSNCQ